MDKEKLGKIVKLAKLGEGGEKETALRLVRDMCEKHKLDFDAVMSEDELEQGFQVEYKTNAEKEVVVQIIIRYGATSIDSQIWENPQAKVIGFKTTQQKYIEVLNAISVLIPLFRKELEKMKKATFHGFINKHDLFYKPRLDEMGAFMEAVDKSRKQVSPEEIASAKLGQKLVDHMERATIYKQLE